RNAPAGFLDRTVRSEPRRTIDVDIVGPQPAQAIAQKILHGSRARVIKPKTPGGVAKRTELDADLHAFARTIAQGLRDQQFVVAGAIEIAGVEQRDAGVERGVDGGAA